MKNKLMTEAMATMAKLTAAKKKIEWELGQVKRAIRILKGAQ
jgi:hypothetical protein